MQFALRELRVPGDLSSRQRKAACLLAWVAAIPAMLPAVPAGATVITIPQGTRALNLRIGSGSGSTNLTSINPNVDEVTVTLTPGNWGSGVTADGTVSASSCSTNGIMIQALARTRNGASQRTATLSVNSSTPLSNGVDTIPFTHISWISDGPDIPSGTFSGSSAQVLATFTTPSGRSNCHQFQYSNSIFPSSGTYTSVVTYTLSMP